MAIGPLRYLRKQSLSYRENTLEDEHRMMADMIERAKVVVVVLGCNGNAVVVFRMILKWCLYQTKHDNLHHFLTKWFQWTHTVDLVSLISADGDVVSCFNDASTASSRARRIGESWVSTNGYAEFSISDTINRL